MGKWMYVSLDLAAKSPCPLTGWSGSVAYRLLLELIRREAEPKAKIFAHPLYSGDKPILSGVDGEALVLEPERRLSARAVLWEQDLYYLLTAVSKNNLVESPCRAEVTALFFEPLEPALEDGHGLASVYMRFYPTAFMFHGIDVLYPSPQRLAYSLTKTYKELFGGDLKHLADRASTALELTGMRVRQVRVNIGEARAVPAFLGRARLTVYGNVKMWLSLLKIGEKIGVGISRSIGFGKYRIEKTEGL